MGYDFTYFWDPARACRIHLLVLGREQRNKFRAQRLGFGIAAFVAYDLVFRV